MGGDRRRQFKMRPVKVSIHAPAWGATVVSVLAAPSVRVSIHAPAWGATFMSEPVPSTLEVSIHAPAWGATSRCAMTPPPPMFRSTPPHGGRPCCRVAAVERRSFDPRPRMGGDILDKPSSSPDIVSIHAPAWGATCASAAMPWWRAFRSTPPHGGRRGPNAGACAMTGFDPRPRMGGDNGDKVTLVRDKVSIHAPAWGATRFGAGKGSDGHVSIHAPAWGATRTTCPKDRRIQVSIHAPAWGATSAANRQLGRIGFRSTPPHGGRPPHRL